MHLRDRCAAQRLGVERGKQLVHPYTQLLLNDGVDALDGNRRYLFLHALQRRGELYRHHVRARGQHLAQLDEGWPQSFQIADELFRVAVRGNVGWIACGIRVHAREHP